MSEFNFTFKSTSVEVFNDQILQGSPFLIQDYSYKFLIQPKSSFWRFGIRLSKHKEIEFVKFGDRHLQEDPREFRDIHLSIGDKKTEQWVNPNVFHLAQYNFPKSIIDDHLLSSELGYRPQTQVEFRIGYDAERKLINVGYNAEGCASWSTSILIEDYMYFKVFAWADSISFELDCKLQVTSLDKTKSTENKLSPFTVGNITFRLGDMFDSYVRKACNVILLPASTFGTATNNILKRATEIGIPKPPKNAAGSVLFYEPKGTKLLKAGYAYSVDDQKSTPNLISELCSATIRTLTIDKASEKNAYTVNLPLFGTGAGGIDPLDAGIIYDRIFNEVGEKIKLIVSIQNESAYKSIKQRMLGKYVSLKDETLQKPEIILELERELNTLIDHTAYLMEDSGELIALALNYVSYADLSFLSNFKTLETLTLMGCKISDLQILNDFHNLKSLALISTTINDNRILSQIKSLTFLEISQSTLSDLNFLIGLKELRSLNLSGNEISQIAILSELKNLIYLDISHNRISNISSLSLLKNLDHLMINNNRISDIEGIRGTKPLVYLDVSHNNIYDITPVLELTNLQFLKADYNPYVERKNLILQEGDNHLNSIKSLLLRQAESDTREITLPAKVLLLGNHASGKSSLLHFILENDLNTSTHSTHIIKIESYPKKATSIPEAIFFDFGGQDYYHGVYRAFLTAGSIYLVLWNEANNQNQKRLDANNAYTQDFTIHYWLCQKKYYEQEKYNGVVDPVLLIQTHSDIDKRNSFSDLNKIQEFENEFYISLAQGSIPPGDGTQTVNEFALKYLKATLLDLINKKRSKSQEPEWYIDFLNFILSQNSINNYESKSVLTDILPKYNRDVPNKEELLKNDLDQLHKRGIILYYKENTLDDCVWLNPVALVNYIHSNVLTKQRNGSFKGRVPTNLFSDVPLKIKLLLELQKVIFKHEYSDNGQPEYIIPNFLPLADEDSDYEIMTFGVTTPSFILKFKHFFPFGLINQLICHFGDLPEKKKFWRDRLLFTFNNAKVFIHIDFQLLEVKVSCSFSKSHTEQDISGIKSYLFYSIMALYWDYKEILSYDIFLPYFRSGLKIEEISPEHVLYDNYDTCKNLYEKQECRPTDLYISVDDLNFVSYFDLCAEESSVMISSKSMTAKRELADSPKIIPIYPFQPFTKRQLKKQKKVAISYSTKDLNLVHKFRDYLVALHDDELIENPFQCTQLIAGEEWDDEIQRKFNEADIIFFMVSENLMATKYVKDVEIKKAIDRRETDKSFKIVPIILVHCQWQRKGKYNLGNYTALPFKAQPITAFDDQHEAWFCAIELIRIMIERDINPEDSEVVLTNEVKRIQEEYFTKK